MYEDMGNEEKECMERKKGFDVARGIGIFLIVWSHTMSDGEPLRSFLFSFHVPLFFLISGYFLRVEEKNVHAGCTG